MARFAEGTVVPVERSRAEIERIVVRYGAEQFISGWEHGRAVIGFRCKDRLVRFELPLPQQEDFARHPRHTWKKISLEQQTKAYEAECRRRWRCLALAIKAKLEVVEAGIATFEEEFLAHIVLPGGATFGQWATKALPEAYASGRMPPLLPPGPSG